MLHLATLSLSYGGTSLYCYQQRLDYQVSMFYAARDDETLVPCNPAFLILSILHIVDSGTGDGAELAVVFQGILNWGCHCLIALPLEMYNLSQKILIEDRTYNPSVWFRTIAIL